MTTGKKTLRLLLVASLLAAGSAHAQSTGTLQKIKESGTVVLGVRPAVVPFSYFDDQQKPLGYSQDVALDRKSVV